MGLQTRNITNMLYTISETNPIGGLRVIHVSLIWLNVTWRKSSCAYVLNKFREKTSKGKLVTKMPMSTIMYLVESKIGPRYKPAVLNQLKLRRCFKYKTTQETKSNQRRWKIL